jgi:hypothetical protein
MEASGPAQSDFFGLSFEGRGCALLFFLNPTDCMCESDDTGSTRKPKKRKPVSDAEKMAIELSKMIFSVELRCKFRIENEKLVFSESAKSFQAENCTWQSDRLCPSYCKDADLQFEAYLPDRKHLTRFTARCFTCYDETVSGIFLYCAYCDEVLTGSIAGPGGKITDHLITIRHVYQQARVLQGILEDGTPSDADLAKANEYVAKLEEWSDRIRYPVHNRLRRIHFEDLLRGFHQLLSKPALPVRDLPVHTSAVGGRSGPPFSMGGITSTSIKTTPPELDGLSGQEGRRAGRDFTAVGRGGAGRAGRVGEGPTASNGPRRARQGGAATPAFGPPAAIAAAPQPQPPILAWVDRARVRPGPGRASPDAPGPARARRVSERRRAAGPGAAGGSADAPPAGRSWNPGGRGPGPASPGPGEELGGGAAAGPGPVSEAPCFSLEGEPGGGDSEWRRTIWGRRGVARKAGGAGGEVGGGEGGEAGGGEVGGAWIESVWRDGAADGSAAAEAEAAEVAEAAAVEAAGGGPLSSERESVPVLSTTTSSKSRSRSSSHCS